MPTFAYVVKDKAGRTHNGMLETPSRQSLIELLWKQDFVVLSIEERQAARRMAAWSAPRVPAQHLVIFARQLATMVASGIPILGALDILQSQLEDRGFRQVLKQIQRDVESGSSLSESLAKYPRIFSDLFVNMIKAGESSGRLDEILDRLAGYIEKTDGLRRKVSTSMFYPILVSVLAAGITGFLVIVVVPKFREIFTSLGGQLPLPTQLLLNASDYLRRYFLAYVAVGVLAVFAGRALLGTKPGRLWFDRMKLKFPVFGPLLQKVAIARFARTLATLVRSGVPILAALEIVARTAGNAAIERAVMKARTSIREGENIADPLTQSGMFPPMVTRMIAVGEKTGELEKMLSKIAEFYESEVDAMVSALTSLIEPIVIAVLGVIIGGIVVALFLPIFKISQLVTG